jgi:hypothetical protein
MAPESMRFSLPEVMSGMLASLESDRFTDDPVQLTALIEELAGQFSLFAPLAAAVDAEAVAGAFNDLRDKEFLVHEDGRYILTDTGRAHCIRSKRTLFNKGDIEQLEQAAVIFQQK